MANDADIARVKKPVRGDLTYGAEGQEGGFYHSRKLQVPSVTSGLTIGRGYDMKTKSKSQILGDLKEAGVDEASAKKIAAAHGKSGQGAKDFIKHEKLGDFEISAEAQLKLFAKSYAAEEGEVKRIVSKDDVVKKYGKTDWDNLDPAIKDLAVDLKFRGDYTGESRARIQKMIADNDLQALSQEMGKRDHWKNVPKDRFDRRKKFMEDAAAAQQKANPKVPIPAPGPRIAPQAGAFPGASRFGTMIRPMI